MKPKHIEDMDDVEVWALCEAMHALGLDITDDRAIEYAQASFSYQSAVLSGRFRQLARLVAAPFVRLLDRLTANEEGR